MSMNSDKTEFAVGSWWAKDATFALNALRSQLEAAAVIFPELGACRLETAARSDEGRDRLIDAIAQAIGWIEECGSDHEGRQTVLTEARAALKGLRIAPSAVTGG